MSLAILLRRGRGLRRHPCLLLFLAFSHVFLCSVPLFSSIEGLWAGSSLWVSHLISHRICELTAVSLFCDGITKWFLFLFVVWFLFPFHGKEGGHNHSLICPHKSPYTDVCMCFCVWKHCALLYFHLCTICMTPYASQIQRVPSCFAASLGESMVGGWGEQVGGWGEQVGGRGEGRKQKIGNKK